MRDQEEKKKEELEREENTHTTLNILHDAIINEWGPWEKGHRASPTSPYIQPSFRASVQQHVHPFSCVAQMVYSFHHGALSCCHTGSSGTWVKNKRTLHPPHKRKHGFCSSGCCSYSGNVIYIQMTFSCVCYSFPDGRTQLKGKVHKGLKSLLGHWICVLKLETGGVWVILSLSAHLASLQASPCVLKAYHSLFNSKWKHPYVVLNFYFFSRKALKQQKKGLSSYTTGQPRRRMH